MNTWVRLYHDTPADPKWRVIAKRSGQRIGDVIAVWTFVLTNASANETERGRTHNLVTEDIAGALDIETEQVDAILAAMEGKVIETGKLTGWKKRNPIKEDGAAERAKAWRERKRTQTNANERPNALDKDTDKIREEKKDISAPKRARKKPFPADWQPTEDHKTLAAGLGVDWRDVAQTFRDYLKSTGKQYADYDAAFRNFLKNERKFHGAKHGANRPKSELIQAADSLVSTINSWGLPYEVGGGENPNPVRLLPQGGRERPGDLHGSGGGGAGGVRAGRDLPRDGSENGTTEENEIPAEPGRSLGGVRAG